MKGQIIGGEFGKIFLRQKSEENLELGELLISDDNILLQVYSLNYGSQVSMQNLELISGMKVEEQTDVNFFDNNLRNYKIALLKTMITIEKNRAKVTKTLPKFFSIVREITRDDLSFLTKPKDPLFIGNLRSGSKELDVEINLPGEKVLSHHVLVTATTGRGKSNLTSNILWHTIDKDYCGFLVLDPHDEYFGRNGKGLKNHSSKENVVYYTIGDVPAGGRTLKINLKLIRPNHFNGVLNFTDPQSQAMSAYYKKYGNAWITSIVLDKPLDVDFHEGTISVVKRKLLSLLDLEYDGERLFCSGIYDLKSGESTVADVVSELESAKTVIIDTSSFSGPQEILVGSLITNEVFRKYKKYKKSGNLKGKPIISIVLEEAPRVLGKEVLEKGSNIFSTIAREGRKFSVGLFAITQLPSLIPRQILANMNTKIILGVEMAAERQAIIESAAQDLSTDSSAIASLDVGEAIITSNFTKFAMPVKIPYFKGEEKINNKKDESVKNSFNGVQINS